MTDRVRLDDLTSDQYDHLCDQLARAQAALREALNALVHNGGIPPAEADVDRWRATLDEPAPATPAGTLRRTVDAHVDTHAWTGDTAAVTAWLAGHPHHHDGGQLVIDTIDGPIPVPHGWLLARWPDGDVTVMSPRAAAKRLQPADPATPIVDRPFRTHRQPGPA